MRDIEGYEGKYAITREGEVWSFKNNKFLKASPDGRGYRAVGLCNNSQQKVHKNHILLAKAYIPNPENKPFLNHKNGIKTDNHIENLEWCTGKENLAHARKTGLNKNFGEGNNWAKLTNTEVQEIRNKYTPRKHHMGLLAQEYGVTKETIWAVIHQRSWKHL